MCNELGEYEQLDGFYAKKKKRKWPEVTTPRRSKVMVIPQKK
jgi:hypothetical protein